MKKHSQRALNELYEITERITEPEITPVLEGNCRIQGPTDELDHEFRRINSGTFIAENNFPFLNKSFQMGAESGTCNVCSAPCKSCMHDNKNLLAMESKEECGSSCNRLLTKEDGSSFICANEMPRYENKVCDDLQHTGSGASNLLSASSSHDSYSENAESKVSVRTSAICGESEDVDMPPVSLRDLAGNQFLDKKNVTINSLHGTSLKQDDEVISCLTGNKDSNVEVCHYNVGLDKKISTCSSTPNDVLLSKEVDNIVKVEATDCFHCSENEESLNKFRRQITCPKASLKEFEGSVNAALPDKSNLMSPQNGCVVCHNKDCFNADNSCSCQLNVDGKSSLGTHLIEDILEENKAAGRCLEIENGLDKEIPFEEVVKSTTVDKEFEMSNLVADNVQESQQVVEDGNSESELELTDVKVCDICGDAGREYLLAICSKCSDGAEHTYCMRKMLRKVPEGEWFCEDCQLKEESERKITNRLENVPLTTKICKLKIDPDKKLDRAENLTEKAKECKPKVHTDTKKGDRSEAVPEASKLTKQKISSSSNLKSVPKLDMKAIDQDRRKVPNNLQSPRFPAKRHAESHEVMSPNRKKLRDNNGKYSDMGSPRKKPCLSRETSFKNLDIQKERAANISLLHGGQNGNKLHGISHSQSMLLGSRLSKVPSPLQSPCGFLARSSSFNNINPKSEVKQYIESGSVKSKLTRESSFNEAKKEALFRSKSASFKGLASKTQFIDPKSVLHKMRKKEKMSASTIDRYPINAPSPRASTSIHVQTMDKKIIPRDVKLNNPFESSSPRLNKESDTENKGTKKQSTYSAKVPRIESLKSMGDTEDHKSCLTPRVRACGNSSSPDKWFNNTETAQQKNIIKNVELALDDDKSKLVDKPSSEIQGHATQFCSIDRLKSSNLKHPSENNLRIGNNKGNKWKDAVKKTILNSRLHNNNGQGAQLEVPSISKDTPLATGTSNVQDNSNTSDGSNKAKQNFPLVEASGTSSDVKPVEDSFCPEAVDLNGTAYAVDELTIEASRFANAHMTSAIPDLEYIWQGSLEIWSEGGSAPFDGIQAHLSTSASPKVLETATKLPCKILLEEVPWISSWPLQFQGVGPDEHNIALFFFAKDIESYEKCYSKLMEKMLKNDLALKGIIDGVELLVFPSTKLPVHSQRWNRLFFLWGLFKARKADNLSSELRSQKKPLRPNLNLEPEIQDLPSDLNSAVSNSTKSVLVENPDIKLSTCDMSPAFVETIAMLSPKVEDDSCMLNSPSVQKFSILSGSRNKLQSEYSIPPNHFPSNRNHRSTVIVPHPGSSFQLPNTFPCPEVTYNYNHLKSVGDSHFGGKAVTPSAQIPAINMHIGHSGVSRSFSTFSDCRNDQATGRDSISDEKEMEREETSMKYESIFHDNYLSWDYMTNPKRARTCSTEAVPQANHLPLCSPTSRETLKMKSSSKVHPLFSNNLNEDCGESINSDNTRITKEERFFFPVELRTAPCAQSDNLIHMLSSDDEDALDCNTPNLELALWNKHKNRIERKWKLTEGDDDVSASLSLSLAIPTPKKVCLKSEENLQERSDVNTSLLLFGRSIGT